MGALENLIKSITPPPLSSCARGWAYCAAVAVLAAAGVSNAFLELVAMMAFFQAIRNSCDETTVSARFRMESCRLLFYMFGALSLGVILNESSLESIIYADVAALAALWIIEFAARHGSHLNHNNL